MKRCLSILLIVFFTNISYAFKFSPMSVGIDLSKNEKHSVVFLENDSSAPIAIEVTLAKRVMDINGSETHPIEENNLQAYPSQLIIPPFEKRSVKISYTGTTEINDELSYRIIAEQLPIEIEKKNKGKMNVKILLRYIGALYVFNDKMEANIKLKSKKIEKEKMEFVVANEGGKHQLLTNLKLKLKKDKEKEVIIDSSNLKLFTGENILAKSERLFTVSKTKELSNLNDSYEVELVFDKEK